MRMTASWFGSLDPPNTRLWRDRSALERGLPSDRHLADQPDCIDGAAVLGAVKAKPWQGGSPKEATASLDSSCARRLGEGRVGTKKRAFRSNKETDEGKKMGRSAETS